MEKNQRLMRYTSTKATHVSAYLAKNAENAAINSEKILSGDYLQTRS